MISSKTIAILESPNIPIPYILGTRMRKVMAIRDKVLSHPGRYQEVRPQGDSSQDPASLKVKEVMADDTRYIRLPESRPGEGYFPTPDEQMEDSIYPRRRLFLIRVLRVCGETVSRIAGSSPMARDFGLTPAVAGRYGFVIFLVEPGRNHMLGL